MDDNKPKAGDELVAAKAARGAAMHKEWVKRVDVIEKKSGILADALGYSGHLFYLSVMSDADLQKAVENCDIEYVNKKIELFKTLEGSELSNARFQLRNEIFSGVEIKAGLINGKIEDLMVD